TIFDMFVRADHPGERTAGGLGVGLGLAKRLVEMHGGSIEVRSEGVGRGSEFTVRLPLAIRPTGEAKAADPEPAAPRPVIRRRILVADDNEDSAETMSVMLRLCGCEVHTAHDGLAAVEAAAALRPDVVVLDIGMPKLDGYGAARRIREQPW